MVSNCWSKTGGQKLVVKNWWSKSTGQKLPVDQSGEWGVDGRAVMIDNTGKKSVVQKNEAISLVKTMPPRSVQYYYNNIIQYNRAL